MTIADELIMYVNGLDQWAQTVKATVAAVPNLRLFWEQASTASDIPKVLFCFDGETARGPFSRAAATRRVDRKFKCSVTRGRGYASIRGTTLITQVGNADPFLDQVEYVRDYIRSITNISVENPIDYKSIKSFEYNQRLVVDGYIIEFSTAHDLSLLSQTSNLQPV